MNVWVVTRIPPNFWIVVGILNEFVGRSIPGNLDKTSEKAPPPRKSRQNLIRCAPSPEIRTKPQRRRSIAGNPEQNLTRLEVCVVVRFWLLVVGCSNKSCRGALAGANGDYLIRRRKRIRYRRNYKVHVLFLQSYL